MKNFKNIIIFGFLIIIFSNNAFATDHSIYLPIQNTTTPVLIPAAPNIDAKGYVLIDANSGYIIAKKNVNKRMPPASLTKLMTLYIAASALKNGQINLNDKVRISKQAWSMSGSKMFVKEGTKVPVKELIQGIIVASGNDATYALAEYIGGTEKVFVDFMNQTAAHLEMDNTHYTDSNGLPASDHYTTPGDLAKLARAWIENYPEYYSWFKQKWITYNGIKQPNRNRLLWRDPSVDGIKTGHTDNAGYCLIASADRDGMRLISIVMDTPTDSSRADGSEALLNYGFRFYESHKLYASNIPLITPRIWFGKRKTIGLGLAQDLYITISKGQYKNVKSIVALSDSLKAPIVSGQQVGIVKVLENNQEIAEQPLIALQNDAQGGLWGRFIDHILLFFYHLFGYKTT